MVVNNYINIER